MNQKEEERQVMERLEELTDIEEDREMGTANEVMREAHPIAAMQTINNKVIELHSRLSDLEGRLNPLLLPHHDGPQEEKDPSQTAPPARSDLMDSIESADQRISAGISYVSGIIARLDL